MDSTINARFFGNSARFNTPQYVACVHVDVRTASFVRYMCLGATY